MGAAFKLNRRPIQIAALTLASILFCLVVSPASAHEWTLDGKQVKAKAVDFNGSHVLLEDSKGKRKSVAINELNASDLQYVTNLLTIRNAEIQKRLESQQLEQQRIQLLAQFMDVWSVSIVAPNGQRGWRNYFANDSISARRFAFRDFPNAQIVAVRKLGGTNRFFGNGNAVITPLGIAPIITPLGIRR